MNKKCKECNIEFEAKRKDKVFCSKMCKNKFTGRVWRANNKDKMKQYTKEYRENNKSKIKQQHKEWRAQNKDKLKKDKKKWQEDFKSKHGVSHTTYRRQNILNERIKHNIRVRINKAINKINKSGSAIDELGCSIDYFREYISNKFKEGMSWDNYGEWHIDHIQPLDSFDLTDEHQFKKACHHSNLQPLWAKDNLSKGSKNPFEV